MNSFKNLTLADFCIEISPPANRLSSTSINIYEDGKFNMNGKLAEKLGGQKLHIRFTKDMKHLCLASEGNIYFPKNGSQRLPEVSELLKKAGFSFPAKYELNFDKEQNLWCGTHQANPSTLPSVSVRSTKKK